MGRRPQPTMRKKTYRPHGNTVKQRSSLFISQSNHHTFAVACALSATRPSMTSPTAHRAHARVICFQTQASQSQVTKAILESVILALYSLSSARWLDFSSPAAGSNIESLTLHAAARTASRDSREAGELDLRSLRGGALGYGCSTGRRCARSHA